MWKILHWFKNDSISIKVNGSFSFDSHGNWIRSSHCVVNPITVTTVIWGVMQWRYWPEIKISKQNLEGATICPQDKSVWRLSALTYSFIMIAQNTERNSVLLVVAALVVWAESCQATFDRRAILPSQIRWLEMGTHTSWGASVACTPCQHVLH